MLKNLMIEFEMTRMSPLLSQQQMYERLRSIEKELNTLEKSLQTIKEFVPPPTQDNKLQDVALVNKLKIALLEDNFNFDKVYHNHYKHLNDIKFVDALALWYPKIKVPAHPKEVIAKKIESCLTRDFYEELHEKMQTNTSKEIEKFCSNKIREIFLQNPNSDQATLYKIQENTVLYILGKYRNIVENDTFSQLPLHRKTKIPQITDIDKKLLNIDYNKFVLHVIKEQYLNNKKPNEIKYTDNGITINVAQLSSTPYRYEKTSEKIKTLISSANEIKKARRNYDNFTEEELRARLNYFVSKEIGNNEKILEKIIDFDTCDLSTQDKDSLIKFFRVLDTVLDENATVEDALKRIKAEDIRPKEKDRKQKIERQKIAELLKKEQQKAYELNELKTRFDEAVNYLYMNGLNNCATVSANYRPNNLSNESKENANFVINTINKNIAPDGTFNKSNSSKINSEILAFDAYNYYSKNEPKEEIFDAATKYATQKDGSVDIIKA